MQQRTRRLAIVLGGSLLATVGFLAACSTDNGTTPLPGQSGDGGGRDSAKGDGSTTEPDEDAEAPTDGGGADCSEAPKLRSNDQGFYCAFFKRDAAAGDAGAGSDFNCTHDEICCNPGPKTPGGKDFPPSFCADKAGSCETLATANGSEWVAERGSTWECADKNSCGNSEVCCIFTWANAAPGDKVNLGPLQDNDVPKACNAKQAYKAGGTRCAASCAADEIQLCSLTDDNCTGNQKCTPFSGLFRDLGACQ